MTDYLDLLLDQSISDAIAVAPNLNGPVGPSLKWRYSSALQKAVRRNDPSIGVATLALNACDSGYIWRRASTIAVEDVGLGDPWVVALVLHACRFARLRTKYGGDRLASFLGQLMGRAVKDRLSCDSFCLPYFHPKLAHVRSAVDRMRPAKRAELYRSDDTPFPWRVAAGVALAGPRYGGDVFRAAGGSPEQLSEVVGDLAPYPIRWISSQYAKRARDGMFVALPLVWRKLTSEGMIEVAQGELPERRLIAGVLSAAFDGHTREGRRAISHFGKSCRPVANAIFDVRDKQKLLELVIFTVDSSLLDRRLLSPWSEALYQANLEGEVLASGTSLSQFDQLASLVVENRDDLDTCREMAAE